MNKRYKRIKRPDGTSFENTNRSHALIEKLDRRNPVFEYYKYRIAVYGEESMIFERWMQESFGPSKWYGLIKREIKAGCTVFDDTPWLLDRDFNGGWFTVTHLYFNRSCEPMIFLKFSE